MISRQETDVINRYLGSILGPPNLLAMAFFSGAGQMASFGFGPKAVFMVLGSMGEVAPPAKRPKTEPQDAAGAHWGGTKAECALSRSTLVFLNRSKKRKEEISGACKGGGF